MSNNRIENQRFPSAPDSLTLEEITSKWNELMRLLEAQNRQMSQKKILSTNIVTTDTDYNINEEGVLLVNASVSTRNVHLKNARNCKENIYWIKRTDGNVSNNVLIIPPTGEFIDGSTVTTIASDGCKGIVSDGENYWVISEFHL